MLPSAFGGLRFRVPLVPEHVGFREYVKDQTLRAAPRRIRKTGVL